MRSQTEQQIITILMLPNIPRSKANQRMKFSRLTEFNMRNVFLENHTQNVVEKLVQTLL